MGKSKELAELGDVVTYNGGKMNVSTGIKISPETSSAYSEDTTLSSYSTTNGVYLNGHSSGWLRLNASGENNTHIDLYGPNYPDPDKILFKTGGTSRMTIDASGRVTMPYQPWAFVIVNTPNPTLSSGSVTPYKNVISSQNLSWDTVNGGFTVPVTGVYQISAAMRLEGYNGTYLYYHIHVNGSPALGSPHFLGQPSAGSGFGTAAATTSIKLVQNDSVRIHWNWSGNNPLVCYASQSYVSVALLG